MTRPADNQWSAVADFPGLAFLALEWWDSGVREGNSRRALFGGEDDDRVVEFPHVLELLEHVADIVVHLLHAGFVDAPVLAAMLTYHGHVLVREYSRDVHASRVVP